MLSHKIFDHPISDPHSSLSKVRIVGNTITFYFHEKDFDNLPDFELENYSPFNERMSIHHDVHHEDKDSKNPHIHFINENSILIRTKELSAILDYFMQIQEIMKGHQHTLWFKISNIISKGAANTLLHAYDKFINPVITSHPSIQYSSEKTSECRII